MKALLHTRAAGGRPSNPELSRAMQRSLDNKYSQLCKTARHAWERSAGRDPSDACVSVRISNGTLRDSRSRLGRALSYGL